PGGKKRLCNSPPCSNHSLAYLYQVCKYSCMEPIIFIDEQSKDPIYRQIVEQVRRHVATGVLVPGDELPSLRQLATDLNVHLNTIALAYRELERQGIIRLRQGSGASIVPVDRARLGPSPQA